MQEHRATDSAADLVVTADTIHTVEPTLEGAGAFAVREGRFVYVGTREGALALCGPATLVLDLGAATVLPGLIDAHVHLIPLGEALERVALSGARSFEDVVERVVAFAGTTGDPWIIGGGWDHNDWTGAAFPTHHTLSRAIVERPVALRRVDGHAMLVNARALALAGVTALTDDPPGGRILRDSDGNPTGVLLDTAMDLIERIVPPATHDQLVRWARVAIAEANRFGVTAAGEAMSSSAAIAAYEELGRAGDLRVRIHAMLHDDAASMERFFARGPVSGEYGGRLSTRAIKMFADGALGSRGAALLEPYADDPGNAGLIRATPSEIFDMTSRALAAGFQMCVHAIGDKANRMVLDAYEAALTSVAGDTDRRLRIEHAQVVSRADIPRFKALGVIPSVQSGHRKSDMRWAAARLGPQRLRDAYPWRALLDTGVTMPNGTDAPVESIDTRRTFYAAIEPGRDGMTRDEALKSMTIWGAHANFAEREIGSIAPGKYADFVVMDRDLMKANAESILGARIIATYSSGRCVYAGDGR